MGRRKQEEHAHSESWLVSYCDMISLLVTFFLMMMTFSTKDQYDVKEVGVALLKGRGGPWNNPLAFPLEQEVDPTVVGVLARDLAALVENGPGEDGEQSASLKPASDGFAISFDLRSSFQPGSAEPTSALRENMAVLGRALERYTHLIVVEGFTDAKFQPTPSFPDAAALGIARAQAAAAVLLAESRVSPGQVQIASPGALRPRATNDTPSGRHSNRRVEVRVVSLAPPGSGPASVLRGDAR